MCIMRKVRHNDVAINANTLLMVMTNATSSIILHYIAYDKQLCTKVFIMGLELHNDIVIIS